MPRNILQKHVFMFTSWLCIQQYSWLFSFLLLLFSKKLKYKLCTQHTLMYELFFSVICWCCYWIDYNNWIRIPPNKWTCIRSIRIRSMVHGTKVLHFFYNFLSKFQKIRKIFSHWSSWKWNEIFSCTYIGIVQ